MRYKLLAILIMVFVSFSFLAEPTFAKHIDGHLTASEVATAFDTFGKNEDEMRKACEGAAPPDLVDDCIIAKKNMFCWWITGQRNKVRGADGRYNEGAYEECVHETVKAKVQVVEAGTRAAQVGMTGVPGPGVAGGAGSQIAGELIKGAQTAEQVIEQGKEMEKERKEKEKFDKTSTIQSLNQRLLNQKIPTGGGILLMKDETINIVVMKGDPGKSPQMETERHSAFFGVKIKDGVVSQISEGVYVATGYVYLSENKINTILKSRTDEEALNIIVSSLRDGSIKASGVGAINSVKYALIERFGTLVAKFQPSPFDVKKGQTKTVNFGGREATLERNPIGQRIVSVANSNVVYRVNRGGERLGYSTKGTQKLVNSRSPTKCAYKQCPSTYLSETAGTYTVPIFVWDDLLPPAPPITTATITVG